MKLVCLCVSLNNFNIKIIIIIYIIIQTVQNDSLLTLYNRWVCLASSAFLKKGAKNLNKSSSNCWNSTHPFCCGVLSSNFDMNIRWEISSSQAYANPGARDGFRAWSTVLYVCKTWKLIASSTDSGWLSSNSNIMKILW